MPEEAPKYLEGSLIVQLQGVVSLYKSDHGTIVQIYSKDGHTCIMATRDVFDQMHMEDKNALNNWRNEWLKDNTEYVG